MKNVIRTLVIAGLVTSGAALANTKDKDKYTKVRDIHKNPAAWTNKKVTVKGEVEHLDANAKLFVLDGDGIFNDRILVLEEGMMTSSQDVANQLKDDDKVVLTGTVKRMTMAEIENKYGVTVTREIKDDFEGRVPVLVTKFSDVNKNLAE